MSVCLLSSTKKELQDLSCFETYVSDLQNLSETANEEEIILPDLEKIVQLPEINDSFFASWKVADVPVIFVAGLAGSLGSYFSRDFFAELHDKWGNKPALKGGHSGETIDRVPDADQAGGWGHRWRYGHDLLNPFEIDWSEYEEIARESGTFLPVWMKAALYWIRHLIQDTFSKEGLPIPGHSYLLRLLNWIQYLLSGGKEGDPWIDPETDHEMLKIFGTIKMRDVAGTALTTLIMKLYLWGTEENWKEANSKQNYRTCSLMLGAYWVNLCTGLMVPRKSKTLNLSAIYLIRKYLFALVKINILVSKLLQERDEVIKGNWIIIGRNDARLNTAWSSLQKKIDYLDAREKELSERYDKLFPKGL